MPPDAAGRMIRIVGDEAGKVDDAWMLRCTHLEMDI
jgi:hypothetical protein